jgi:putative membrane protein
MLISVLVSFGIDEQALAIMIIALYPANLIASCVPSIFFGVPDSNTVVAVLPGQRMVLEGKGLDALKVVLLSSIAAGILSIIFLYFSIDFFSFAYGAIRTHMKWILLGISILLLIRTKKPHFSAFIFLISGLLGKLAFNSELVDPFLPLFSGMFAIAAILNYKKSNVPEQKEQKVEMGFLWFVVIGCLLGMLADLIPGIGSPAQVATFATIFMSMNTMSYLATISAISVSQVIFSLTTTIAIDKSRIGAIVWLAEFIDIEKNLALLACLFVISLGLSVFFVYAIRKRIARIATMDFSKINLLLACYLVAITMIIDGVVGLEILALSSALGWLTIRLEVERTNLMGSIIIPTLLLLFRIFWV